MKLLRFGPKGQERPGAVDAQGKLRDLSLLIPDWTPEWLDNSQLHIFGRCGHWTQIEHAAEFCQLLRNFLKPQA
jgi:pimeloyl-ACP methyl ester carboxylesterase